MLTSELEPPLDPAPKPTLAQTQPHTRQTVDVHTCCHCHHASMAKGSAREQHLFHSHM